jgi:alpha-glucosidase
MRWSDGAYAGFSTAAPWLPIGIDYTYANVEREQQDPDSMLALYRRLIQLRRAEPPLSVGTNRPAVAGGDLFAYVSEAEGRRFLIVLNLRPRPAHLSLSELNGGQIGVATQLRREGERVDHRLVLLGDDGVVLRLD